MRPIRLRHETLPLIAMPRGGGFVLGLGISVGYNPATVDHWMFDLAAKHGATRPRFWTDNVSPSGQTITLSYPLDTLSEEDDSEVTIDTVAATGICEWGLTAYNAENEILWRAQGDVDFDAPRGGLEGTSAGIGSPIEISLGGETTFTITILGNAEAGGLDAAGLAALIHAGTAKSTLADNDAFGIVDSAASNGFKKTLWSAIKSTLRTAFDLVYATAAQGTAAEAAKTKTDFLTVTASTDLDAIRTRVNELDASVVLKGAWDASAGTFPGAGAAQAGWSYIVTVAGTVGGIAFAVNDRLLAYADNASTSTYANNWLKLDYTDQVLSVAGLTGAIAASDLRTSANLVGSVTTGITGADAITNMVSLTQAEYDAIGSPSASTLYVIVG